MSEETNKKLLCPKAGTATSSQLHTNIVNSTLFIQTKLF
jgi:hypothetical protein